MGQITSKLEDRISKSRFKNCGDIKVYSLMKSRLIARIPVYSL